MSILCSKEYKIFEVFCKSYPMAPFTLIHGCMFAGKTKALFRHVQQSNLLTEEILLVKHAVDTRYQQDYIVSHDGERRECSPIRLPTEIPYLLNEQIKLVAIDEVQFFDNMILHVIEDLIMKNIEVVAAGLLKDFRHHDFGPMNALQKIASTQVALKGVCHNCGKPATHTYRKQNIDPQVLIGGSEMYEARCETCYQL